MKERLVKHPHLDNNMMNFCLFVFVSFGLLVVWILYLNRIRMFKPNERMTQVVIKTKNKSIGII